MAKKINIVYTQNNILITSYIGKKIGKNLYVNAKNGLWNKSSPGYPHKYPKQSP